MRARQWLVFATFAASVLCLVRLAALPLDRVGAAPGGVEGQDQGEVREFTIVGDHYTFSPNSIQVNKNDLVKITFTARDIAHSFAIDDYRIVKRANAGQTVTFEFRADRSGPCTFYCNLSLDPKCKDMKGSLSVR